MADEYRIHLLAAEVLQAGGGEARIFANAVTVIHGDQADLPNAHIFSLNVNALHGDQQSLPNAHVHGIALEVLTSTVQELAPNFVQAVDDSDVFPLRTFGFAVPPPFLIEDRERNPYPASFIAVDPDEQQRIIREQHNSTQAGDSTFDFGLLLRPTPDQLYTLGSLGKFYHDDYGMIHARYVRIDSWIEVDAQGCPVGRLAVSPEVDWLVTNDFSKSSADLAMGFTFFGTTPKAGEYGWMVVDGANPAMALPSTAILPAPDTPYTWTGTGTIGIGTIGKIIARRWGTALLATIPEGTLYVRTEGLSPTSFAELVQQETLELAGALAALTVRISASESNILALSTQGNSLAAGLNSLELALTAETNARVRDISSIRLLVGATDWNQTIADAVGVVREEFSAADELIKVSVAEARFIAEDALARASSPTGPFDEQIGAITNQLAGLSGRLINFTVDYATPTNNDVLIANVTLSPEGNPITRFEGVPFELTSLIDVDVTTVAPLDGDQLTWDSAAGKWVPGVAGSGGGGGGGGAFSGAYVYAAAASFSQGTGTTDILALDTEDFDIGGWYNPATPGYFVVPAGVEYITATLKLADADNIAGQLIPIITLADSGGVDIGIIGQTEVESTGGDTCTVSTGVVKVTPGQRIKAQAFLTNARTLDGGKYGCYFSIRAISTVAVSNTIAVDDEGATVHTAATKLNFVGAGVTATDAGGGEVDVTIPGGGSAGWTLAGSVTILTPVANVDVTGLGSANEILVLVGRLSGVATSASAIRQILLSTNNGASFFTASGDYRQMNAAGTLTNLTAASNHAAATALARSIFCHIINSKVNAPKICYTANGTVWFVADDVNPVNAIRVNATAGANLTSGEILVFTR